MYSFPNLEPVCCSMSGSNYCFLTWHRFLRRQVRWSGIPIILRIFHSSLWSTQSKSLEKVSFHPIPKKGNAKKCSNYCTVALISHTSKIMLKILAQNSMQTVNFQIFKLDLEKAEEPEIKLSTSLRSLKKQESSRKYLPLLYWLCQSL